MKSFFHLLAAVLAAAALNASAVQSHAVWTITSPGDALENGDTHFLPSLPDGTVSIVKVDGATAGAGLQAKGSGWKAVPP